MNVVRWICAITILSCLLFLTNQAAYPSPAVKEGERLEQAKAAFQEIVDLWYEQKFDELYARFAHKGGISRGKFIDRMTYKKKMLACCWQKIQDVKVKLFSSNQVLVSAKFGFEDQVGRVVYVTEEIPLYLKDDRWRVKIKDIISTAPDLEGQKSKHEIR